MLIALGIFIALSITLGAVSFIFFKKSTKQQLENQILFNELDIYKAKLHENDIQIARFNEKLSSMENLENSLVTLESQLETLRDEKEQLSISYSTVKQQFEDKNKHIDELKVEFKTLASEVLDNNSKKFSEQNKESIGHLLNPMKVQLTEFKKKVEDVYEKEAKDRNILQYELKTLKELNHKISTDAINLTNALKGESKTQGTWGEMVLERVLESSGLRLNEEYIREEYLKDENGKGYRPDVIVKLPENRDIIIDSKTSLTAYEGYVSAVNDDEKQSFLNAHVISINNHINELSDKKYEDLKGVNSLDFIFMFVPIESALMLALENDKSLFDKAFKKKIVLVSPTTLLVALKAVENSWRYEKQARSIADVYDRATKLYEKLEGFTSTLDNVGKHITKANDEYTKAYSQFSTGAGNVIRQAQMLKDVSNIKPKKEISQDLVEKSLIEN
ncbi:DNA recombination protein RmuC [Arcobacteraceae bacterium]|nr:DNA recombination protein RmuC [Arcobacteraceae bacterium]